MSAYLFFRAFSARRGGSEISQAHLGARFTPRFCWVCMGNWTEHGNSWYSCNRYEEKDGSDARDAQSRSRASLERYLHVCIALLTCRR